MKRSDQINELAKAISAAQRETKPASKDAKNPFYKSSYSDLNCIWEAIREPFTSREIAILQEAVTVQDGVQVTTLLLHSSGQWIEFDPFFIPVVKKDAQGIGSATSYCKRYALCSALCVVSGEEDDGNSISDESKQAYLDKKQGKQNPTPGIITKEQAKELQIIISECQPEYIKWFTEEIKKLNVNSIDNFTIEAYGHFLKQSTENRDNFKRNK